jgi:hypothetical protein
VGIGVLSGTDGLAAPARAQSVALDARTTDDAVRFQGRTPQGVSSSASRVSSIAPATLLPYRSRNWVHYRERAPNKARYDHGGKPVMRVGTPVPTGPSSCGLGSWLNFHHEADAPYPRAYWIEWLARRTVGVSRRSRGERGCRAA